MEKYNLNERVNEFKNRDYVKTIILGVAFIVAGATIILNNLGIISDTARHIIVSWQMLLIVLGIAGLCRKNYMTGAILLLVGCFFIAPLIPGLSLGAEFVQNFWPALLVLCGIIFLIRPRGFYTHKNVRMVDYVNENGIPQDNNPNHRHNAYSTYSEDGRIDQKFVFSGSEQTFMGPVFKGGRLECVFGGTSLDLRNTNLPEDQDVYLMVKGAFGGCTILVPETWNVEVRSTSFLGGVTDARPRVARTSARKLVIDVECAFGGAEIR